MKTLHSDLYVAGREEVLRIITGSFQPCVFSINVAALYLRVRPTTLSGSHVEIQGRERLPLLGQKS